MASDHVVMLRDPSRRSSMPSASQKAAQLVDRPRDPPCRRAASGCTSARRTDRRNRHPGRIFPCPPAGWPGMKCTPSGTCGCICAMTAGLGRADIGEDRSPASAPARSPAPPRQHAPTGAADDDQIGITGTASCASVVVAVAQPKLGCARASVAALRVEMATWPARPSRRMTRASRRTDQADADQRDLFEHR